MAYSEDSFSLPVEGFDEAVYLSMNPDVRRDVGQGKISSGWKHFVSLGYRENRPGVAAGLCARLRRDDSILADLPLPPNGYAEAAYLAVNPDIRVAIEAGKLKSGWHHFLGCGYHEHRPGIPAGIYQKLDGVLGADAAHPMPPTHLRHRVHGSEDAASFGTVGRRVANCLDHILGLAGCKLPQDAKILDFGCGCGRVIKYLKPFLGGCEFFGTDIDGEAIAWCQANLVGMAGFSANRDMPPLPYPDGFFDLVYSISIFTHLPEDMQFAWLEELRRVTKPGGHLVLTVHGDNIFPSQLRKASKNGFYYSVGKGTQGLPTFYQTSFHAEAYILGTWSRYFEIADILKFPEQTGIAQSFVLCRRTDRPIASVPYIPPHRSGAEATAYVIEQLATDENFDEAAYVLGNPDVAKAIEAGKLASGRLHFEFCGRTEGRKLRHPLSSKSFAPKARKLDRIRNLLRSDMEFKETGNGYDFLTDRLRADYNIIDTSNVSSNHYDQYVLELIDRHGGGLVLDCGAGNRPVYFDNVVNFDIVDYDTTDVRGVGEALPFIDGAFDAVISIAVLEHVKDPFSCAREIARVLKPGGELMCCVPFLQPFHGYPHHYYNMTHQGLVNLFKDTLEIDKVDVYSSLLPIWTLTWMVKAWADGLKGKTREDFLDLRLADLMESGDKYLDRPFVSELAREKNFELASATMLFAHKKASP